MYGKDNCVRNNYKKTYIIKLKGISEIAMTKLVKELYFILHLVYFVYSVIIFNYI